MNIKFRKFSEFQRGIIYEFLKDGYSFESRYERDWSKNWKDADDFFYDNLQIADECGFVTTLNETDLICSAIHNHSSKVTTHSAFDEVLKDADVLQHYLYNPLFL